MRLPSDPPASSPSRRLGDFRCSAIRADSGSGPARRPGAADPAVRADSGSQPRPGHATAVRSAGLFTLAAS